MKHFEINVFKRDNIEDIIAEMHGMETPCIIKIYDRVLQFDTKEEFRMFRYGLEVGNYVALDKKEGLK